MVTTLGVIHAPDTLGLACDFRPKSFPVTPGRAAGLPNIPNYRLGPLMAQVAEAGSADTSCLGSSTQLGVPDTSGNLVFDWVPGAGLDDPTAAQPLASPAVTVYSSDGYRNDWSGTNLPASTYYYRIQVRSQRGGDKVGYFDLVRGIPLKSPLLSLFLDSS